ncbi:hypothetical protein DFS33DRAFT_1385693 [Desarmillaria ectypa]|nr:hypothetical protein DFS33DRAFT_1385693 [Desarmillaria ectypa]
MPSCGILVGIFVSTLILFKWLSWWKAAPSLVNVTGPPAPSFVLGHTLDLERAPVGTRHNKWAREYGPTYRLLGPFGVCCELQDSRMTESGFRNPEPSLVTLKLNHVLQSKNFERNASDTMDSRDMQKSDK